MKRHSILSVALMLAGCASAHPIRDVSLAWKPTDDVTTTTNAAARALAGLRVRVMSFVDERDQKVLIGRNVENARQPLDVTSRDDVGAWCAGQMRVLLKQSGVEIVETDPAIVISGHVAQFFVNEENVYAGAVALRLTVQDGAGKPLWERVVAGSAKRWGRSYQRDNYFEVLSDAYLHALQEMFADEAFRTAVRHKA
jgi:hypothetical protein